MDIFDNQSSKCIEILALVITFKSSLIVQIVSEIIIWFYKNWIIGCCHKIYFIVFKIILSSAVIHNWYILHIFTYWQTIFICLVCTFIISFFFFCADEKKEMYSSTTKTNRHTTSKSNFSLVEDSAQFRSTKVLVIFHSCNIPFESLLWT